MTDNQPCREAQKKRLPANQVIAAIDAYDKFDGTYYYKFEAALRAAGFEADNVKITSDYQSALRKAKSEGKKYWWQRNNQDPKNPDKQLDLLIEKVVREFFNYFYYEPLVELKKGKK